MRLDFLILKAHRSTFAESKKTEVISMDKECAIYLVGDGPRREPRPIELQHVRILRYLRALEEKTGTYFSIAEEFVDLNWPRTNWWDPENFPAFMRLCSAIRDKRYDTVVVDLAPGDPRNWVPYDSVIPLIRGIGAQVYNSYFDDEKALADKIARQYGKAAHAEMVGLPPSDASDLLAFFPALVGNVAMEALRHNDDYSDISEAVGRRLHYLTEQNPYAAGQYPFLEDRLHRRIWDRAKKLEEEEGKRRRDAGERLFRLGPNHTWVVIDEGFYGSDTSRTSEELAWAEKRLVEELRFSKGVDGQIVSYIRELDGNLFFGDPRPKGFLGFRVYPGDIVSPEAAKRRRKKPEISVSPTLEDFRLPDKWKNDLEKKFIRLARERLELLGARHRSLSSSQR
jgi:hypothetical protein